MRSFIVAAALFAASSYAWIPDCAWNDCMGSWDGSSCTQNNGWECLCSNATAIAQLNTCVATSCTNSSDQETIYGAVAQLCANNGVQVTNSQQATFSATSGGSLLSQITDGPKGWGPGKHSSINESEIEKLTIPQPVVGTLEIGPAGSPPALVLYLVHPVDGAVMEDPGVATAAGVDLAVGDLEASVAHGVLKPAALLAMVTSPGQLGPVDGDPSHHGLASGLAAVQPPPLPRPLPLQLRLSPMVQPRSLLARHSVFRLLARLALLNPRIMLHLALSSTAG
jgi:CFEM domain